MTVGGVIELSAGGGASVIGASAGGSTATRDMVWGEDGGRRPRRRRWARTRGEGASGRIVMDDSYE